MHGLCDTLGHLISENQLYCHSILASEQSMPGMAPMMPPPVSTIQSVKGKSTALKSWHLCHLCPGMARIMPPPVHSIRSKRGKTSIPGGTTFQCHQSWNQGHPILQPAQNRETGLLTPIHRLNPTPIPIMGGMCVLFRELHECPRGYWEH